MKKIGIPWSAPFSATHGKCLSIRKEAEERYEQREKMNINEAMKTTKLDKLSKKIAQHTALEESILDPIHKVLNRNVFGPDKKMIAKVRTYLIDTFNEWLADNLDYDTTDIKRMELVGSSTGFQYTDTSDLDVNVVLEGITKPQIDKVWTKLQGSCLAPSICSYLAPDAKDETRYDAIYDLLNDDWVKEQKKEDVHIPIPMSCTLPVSSWRQSIFALPNTSATSVS